MTEHHPAPGQSGQSGRPGQPGESGQSGESGAAPETEPGSAAPALAAEPTAETPATEPATDADAAAADPADAPSAPSANHDSEVFGHPTPPADGPPPWEVVPAGTASTAEEPAEVPSASGPAQPVGSTDHAAFAEAAQTGGEPAEVAGGSGAAGSAGGDAAFGEATGSGGEPAEVAGGSGASGSAGGDAAFAEAARTGGEPAEVPGASGAAGSAGGDAAFGEATGSGGEPAEVAGGSGPAQWAGDAPGGSGADSAAGDGAAQGVPGGDVPPRGGGGGATAAGFPAGGVPPADGPWSAFSGRRLARSSQRKVIAGVAGGLGEYTGIDPVLFRVLFAVLTLFGGSGILLYVVGWLFMPAEDERSSPVESLLHRGPGGSNRARDAAAAGALVIAGLVLAGVLALGDARDLALVLVVVGGAFFLVRNLQERRDGGPPQPVMPAPAPPPPAPYETPLPTYQPAPAYQPPPTYQPPPAYPPVQQAAPTVTLPPPPPPAPPREHSALGMITICLLLVVLGVAAALAASGAIDPEADDLLAVAVGTIGAGLLVGAWFGRARWLTWLGIPLVIALIVASTSNVSFKGGAGDRRYEPQTAAEVQPEYRVGVGNIRLDLSDVDLSKQLVRTKVSAGVGNIQVIVPRTADVSVDGRAGIGEVDLLGQVANGTSAQRSVIDQGPAGDARIDLTLDLDVSIGRVEVDRAAA